MSTAKKIVENVLSIPTTKKLWTFVYSPVLPFYPNDFSLGALLPAILYMFRWGHRRGKGAFIDAFGKQEGEKIKLPSIEDVVASITTRTEWFSGFDGAVQKAICGDLLLTYCVENKNHLVGRTEQIQRAYPTHYMSSHLDLPKDVSWLRYVPEMIVTLLVNQEDGEYVNKNDKVSYFSVGTGFNENILLKLLGHGMQIKGDFQSSLTTSDQFIEEKNLVGIDQLFTIRIAQACGEAPMKARGSGESEKIPNQHPVAKKAANYFREDISVFVQAYGETVPRQAFFQMLESCISLGLATIYLSTAKMLLEWERTGTLPENYDQQPWALFVDCSTGNDTRLKRLAEESMSDLLRRFERIPVIIMCMRILDDKLRYDRAMRDSLPAMRPDATEFINLLGSMYKNNHSRAERILDQIDEMCLKLAEAFKEADEEASIQELLKQSGNPVLRLAEALTILMGIKQFQQFVSALDSSLIVNQPNGLATKRKIQQKDATGKIIRGDARSIVFTNPVLDFIVHRHLRKAAKGKRPTSLAFVDLLKLLKDRYGLYVDEVPPGMSIPTELLHLNRQILERRLRDLGILVGVNDAESMKRLQQRFMAKGDGNDE